MRVRKVLRFLRARSRVFLLAVGLVLAAPGCGAALPSAGADPVPIPGCHGGPIRAVDPLIRVRLAVLSGADPAADPNPAVWRIGHGEGWLFRAPGVRWRGSGFFAVLRTGWRYDTPPLKGCCTVTFGYRARTC